MNRRICAFAAMMFFALCMALGCFETCFATDDTNEYSIKSADFDIRMNEDGSAKVTEKWKVKYETGTATSFCKDIYKISKGNESFGIVYGFSVKIDGKRCKEGETNKKDDNTYTVENNSHTITISCFKSSSEVERTYEISYVLKNVVKTDGKDWYLIYRVIGENFKKEVWNITVRIYAPAGKRCTEECIYKSYGKSSNPSDRCVKIKCDSNTGILKVGAKISGENVFDLKYENTLYNKDEIRDNDSHINIDKDKDSHINIDKDKDSHINIDKDKDSHINIDIGIIIGIIIYFIIIIIFENSPWCTFLVTIIFCIIELYEKYRVKSIRRRNFKSGINKNEDEKEINNS